MDRLNELIFGCKTVQIQAFGLQVAKEIFHAGIVQAIATSGHTASHRVFMKHAFVLVGGVLESLIAMNQDSGYSLYFYRFIHRIQYQLNIVTFTDLVRHNFFVKQVFNG